MIKIDKIKSMNDNQDLLNLCQLNLMEENIKKSVAPDRDVTLQAIDYKKRVLATRIKNLQIPATKKVMEIHQERNIGEPIL